MIVELGHFALILAFCVALVQCAAPFLGLALRDTRLLRVGDTCAPVLFALIASSFAALVWAHVASDFSVANVYENSHSAKPLLYQISGVWGNHDFGLCSDVSEEVRNHVDARILNFMETLQPYLELDDCFFSHVEPWLDPYDVNQLWYYDGLPDTTDKAARSFSAVSHRFLFLGHFHRWLLMTPDGAIPWPELEPILLGAWKRSLVVVAAVFEGHCAVFDTERTELIPLRC